MKQHHAAGLARYLAAAYALLIIYGSLHPFSGWADSGAPVLDFLDARWPRYFTKFELAMNVAAYLPLGLLLVPAMAPRVKPGWAAIAATFIGAVLSFGLEALQHFLPSRVPSNVDLAFNTFGSFVGAALGMRYGRVFADGGGLARWRVRRIVPGRLGDAGLALITLWLVVQLCPQIALFAVGDLRRLLDLPAPLPYSAESTLALELSVTALNTVAVGTLNWMLMRSGRPWPVGALIGASLLARSFGHAVLVSPEAPLQWLTPGALAGLTTGTALLLAVLLWLPSRAQQAVAALCLLVSTALVNLAPENPYLQDTLENWRQGHFLNFNGLTALAASLWPYLALVFVIVAGPRTPQPTGAGARRR